MPDTENWVTLAGLAGMLGMDRSNARKYALKVGLRFSKVRTAGTRGQLTLALAEDDANNLMERRVAEGYPIGGRTPVALANEKGVFYIVQVVPDLAPNRVKLGFAADARARLAAHKTVAPTARLSGVWPCRRSWETAAMASITRSGCVSLGPEVYDCENVVALLERAEAFFALMPASGNGEQLEV